jgi:hypothetical protein
MAVRKYRRHLRIRQVRIQFNFIDLSGHSSLTNSLFSLLWILQLDNILDGIVDGIDEAAEQYAPMEILGQVFGLYLQ